MASPEAFALPEGANRTLSSHLVSLDPHLGILVIAVRHVIATKTVRVALKI